MYVQIRHELHHRLELNLVISSIGPYHFNLVVCPLVNIGSCLVIHPNWFSGFATVLEFQVGFLDLGKYWKAKNNGESQLAFVNNNTAEGLNPSLRFVISLRLKDTVPTEYLPSEKPKSVPMVN